MLKEIAREEAKPDALAHSKTALIGFELDLLRNSNGLDVVLSCPQLIGTRRPQRNELEGREVHRLHPEFSRQ